MATETGTGTGTETGTTTETTMDPLAAFQTALTQWLWLARLTARLAWLLFWTVAFDALCVTLALWLTGQRTSVAAGVATFALWLALLSFTISGALYAIAWRFQRAADRLVWRRVAALGAAETQALREAADGATDAALLGDLQALYGPEGDFTALDA